MNMYRKHELCKKKTVKEMHEKILFIWGWIYLLIYGGGFLSNFVMKCDTSISKVFKVSQSSIILYV